MKNFLVLATALLFFGLLTVARSEEPASPLHNLEKKLHGQWKGRAACQGDLTVEADGTFVRTNCGPGGIRYAGIWELKWDALPPTLLLSCETSDDADRVWAKEELKVQELNDKRLIVTYPEKDFRWQFERKMK